MDDAVLVRGFERFGDLPRDRQRLVERNRPARDPLREVSPSTSSMTSAVTPSASSRPWMLRDVGVVERGEDLRLALKPGEPFGIGRRRRSGRTLIATSRFSFVSRAR